ncbi:MAG: hypothetical protein R6X02_33940 [Enhygromyxa sp.]
MSTHVGVVETDIEVVADPGPGLTSSQGSTTLDERSRLQQQLARERAIARRTRAEGFSDD